MKKSGLSVLSPLNSTLLKTVSTGLVPIFEVVISGQRGEESVRLGEGVDNEWGAFKPQKPDQRRHRSMPTITGPQASTRPGRCRLEGVLKGLSYIPNIRKSDRE